jgi:hypothetical protein
MEPFGEPGMPQAQFTANRQNGSPPRRHGNLVPRSLPQLHEHRRITEKLFPGCRQRRAILVANEEGAAKLLLERPDPGAHGCLAHIELFRGSHKTARSDDLQKGPRKLDIHNRPPLRANSINFFAPMKLLNSFACLSLERKDKRADGARR